MGGEIATPNMDRLAAEGVRFTQAYNMAKCEPTRNSLIAGQRNTPRLGFYVENYAIPEEFYSTDGFTDFAIRFVGEARAETTKIHMT